MNNNFKIRKILFNEISFGASMIAIVIAVVLFVTGPDAELRQDIELIKKDILTIKTNDLDHIDTTLNELKDSSEKNTQSINEINLKLERVLTILEK